jgi:hypothetical protein
VYGTGSGSYAVAGFGISIVDPSGFTVIVLVNIKMDCTEIDCKDGWCMAQDAVWCGGFGISDV